MEWQELWRLTGDGFIYLDADTREARIVPSTDPAAVVAKVFYDKRDALMAMPVAAFRDEHSKWWPKRRDMLSKYPDSSLQAQKMSAFYIALEEVYRNRRREVADQKEDK